jgi:HK97 family phage prohead protease
MFLHRGGLNTAWAAANGARSGQKAPQEVLDHLQAHRDALGLTSEGKTHPGAEEDTPPFVAKFISNPELQTDDGENAEGEIFGYATVWEIPDVVGDIMTRGTFARSIQERVRAGKVLLMTQHFAHGGGTGEAIGHVTGAFEDEHGLFFKATLYNSQLAKETRAKVLASPAAFGASVGFKPVKGGRSKIGSGSYRYQDAALYEITITPYPALEATSVAAKSGEGAGKEEEENITSRMDRIEVAVEELVKLMAKSPPQDAGSDPDASPDEHEEGQGDPKQKAPSHSSAMKRRISLLSV